MNTSELKNKKVVIAPFNTEAVIVYHHLINDGVEVIAFMDSDRSLHRQSYDNTMIIPYITLNEADAVILTKIGYASEKEIKNEIINSGYAEKNIIKQEDINFISDIKEATDKINMDELYTFRIWDWIALLKDKIFNYTKNEDSLFIKQTPIVVTTRCTLRCKGCCNLIDYYRQQDKRDTSIDRSIATYDKMMEYIDYVNTLAPIGGEPFLNQDIDILLEHIATSSYSKKIREVRLITNATVLPSEKTLSILGKYNYLFRVDISNYGELSTKKMQLMTLLNKFKCTYVGKPLGSLWMLSNRPIVPKIDFDENIVRKKCNMCECKKEGNLRTVDNRIYNCNFVAFASECHAIPDDKRNYLDITTDAINKETLREFASRIVPGTLYCSNPYNPKINNDDTLFIPTAEQTKDVSECIRYE